MKEVKKVEGDASIVFASGKKSCLFDLNMTVDWTATLDESGGMAVRTGEVDPIEEEAARKLEALGYSGDE